MTTSATSTWRNVVCRRIRHKLRFLAGEHEEIQLLRLEADRLREFRRRLLKEKFD